MMILKNYIIDCIKNDLKPFKKHETLLIEVVDTDTGEIIKLPRLGYLSYCYNEEGDLISSKIFKDICLEEVWRYMDTRSTKLTWEAKFLEFVDRFSRHNYEPK